MGKPHVFICFDTEDAINPEADDARDAAGGELSTGAVMQAFILEMRP